MTLQIDASIEKGNRVQFLWLEITGRCQLTCAHCYAGSGPDGTHGTMTPADWENAITQAADVGVRHVQFIGGEPTLHPALPGLICHTLAAGLSVEVYSNLVHVSPAQWEAFSLPRVSLATSWYSADRAQHAAITGRDTWRQTRANIAEAIRRCIPLRAGVIAGIIPDQDAAAAVADLQALGVAGASIDTVRQFGRGTSPDPSQTCGACGQGRAAILPDGTVTPCPMSRWRHAGNVQAAGLAALLGEPLAVAAAPLARPDVTACNPTCTPDSYCNPLCSPGVLGDCRVYAAPAMALN